MIFCACATRGLRRMVRERPGALLARRTRTVKRCSFDARSKGQPWPPPKSGARWISVGKPTYTAPLNFWTACFWLLTIHSAENSGVFEDSRPKGSLGPTGVILISEVRYCFPLRSFRPDLAVFPACPMANSPCPDFKWVSTVFSPHCTLTAGLSGAEFARIQLSPVLGGIYSFFNTVT